MPRIQNITTIFQEELEKVRGHIRILQTEQEDESTTLFSIIRLDKPISEARVTIKRIERIYWRHRHRIRNYRHQIRNTYNELTTVEIKQKGLKDNLVDKIPDQIREIASTFYEAESNFWTHQIDSQDSVITLWQEWQQTFWGNFIQLHQTASYYTAIRRHEEWGSEDTPQPRNSD